MLTCCTCCTTCLQTGRACLHQQHRLLLLCPNAVACRFLCTHCCSQATHLGLNRDHSEAQTGVSAGVNKHQGATQNTAALASMSQHHHPLIQTRGGARVACNTSAVACGSQRGFGAAGCAAKAVQGSMCKPCIVRDPSITQPCTLCPPSGKRSANHCMSLTPFVCCRQAATCMRQRLHTCTGHCWTPCGQEPPSLHKLPSPSMPPAATPCAHAASGPHPQAAATTGQEARCCFTPATAAPPSPGHAGHTPHTTHTCGTHNG
jgi:hypothetical protein